MSDESQTYSRRVSDNPNDAVISVEQDDTPGFPFYVDGTGSQPQRFSTFDEAKAYVDDYCSEAVDDHTGQETK